MRLLLAAITLLACVPRAAAQPADSRRLELGATAGTACLTASSYCGGGQEGLYGVYGSYWLTPRVEVGGRVSMLTQPDVSGTTYYYFGPSNEELTLPKSIRDRSRLYVLGHVYRHFGSDPRIRFYAGVALGRQSDRMTVTCDAPDCSARLARVRLTMETGRQSHTQSDLAAGIGFSGLAGRVGWRAGVNLHNYPGENFGAAEYFAGASLRF